MKNTVRYTIIIGLFVLLLTAVRIVWFTVVHDPPERRQAVQGVLDLRASPLPANQLISLDGEWEFYPDLLLEPGDTPPAAEKRFVPVPSYWSASPNDASYRYGTYRLRVALNPDGRFHSYSIRVPDIRTASQLFVNGRQVGGSGRPAERQTEFVAQNIPYSASLHTDSGEIDIVLQVAHADNGGAGGIVKSIKFGHANAYNRYQTAVLAGQIFVIGMLLIHAIYAGLLYFIGTRQRPLLYFLGLTVSAATGLLVSDDRILLTFIPMSDNMMIKFSCLAATLCSLFLYYFSNSWTFERKTYRIFRLFPLICAVYALLVVLVPNESVMHLRSWLGVPAIGSAVIATVQFARMAADRREGLIYLLLGATAMANSVIWAAVTNHTHLDFNPYPFDLLFCFVMLSAFGFNQYFRTAARTQKLAEDLQRAVKSKDDFLANTSHELRNPLHGMINMAQTVLDRTAARLDPMSAGHLGTLVAVGRRMSLLLNDLLDAARLREQRIQLQLREVSLSSVASGVVDMLSFMIDGKPVRFAMQVDEKFPPVLADENRLIQIVFNLIHNAVKYTEEGTITIAAEARDDEALVHVADTGVGIGEHTLKTIFEPYEQGEAGAAGGVGGGIGLGLSICRQLIELHGGRISVRSAPGQGSTFTFSLPLAGQAASTAVAETAAAAGSNAVAGSAAAAETDVAAKAALFANAGAVEAAIPATTVANDEDIMPADAVAVDQAAALAFPSAASLASPAFPASPGSPAGRPHILAVDDDPVNLQVLVGMLSEEYVLELATSGQEALSKLHLARWNLIICDVMMPRMSGFQFTAAVRERFTVSELPILLLTARVEAEDVRTGFFAGANDYVAKPVNAMELKARVRALTELKQSVEERLRMEAAWLQAQIEPHFLFNTLNSIYSLLESNSEKVKTLLDTFSHFLQMSFDFKNSARVVPFRREWELVSSYLFIMEERFPDRLQIVWDIPDRISENLTLPPLSIQPLVENALHHGILQRAAAGVLRIQLTDLDESVEIAVVDDGVGMDERAWEGLLKSKPWPERGLGLFNTDRRLKQMYGSGLRIRSRPGLGTTVSFRVPKPER